MDLHLGTLTRPVDSKETQTSNSKFIILLIDKTTQFPRPARKLYEEE